MLTSTGDIIDFFEKEGFIPSLWIAWEDDRDSFWDTLYSVMQEAWDEFGESKGYIPFEDADNLRDFIAQKFEEEIGITPSITNKMQTKSIGDFEAFLNEAKNSGLSATEVKKIIKSEINKELKNYSKTKDTLTKYDVKEMIRKMLVNQYKYLWQKSAFFINNI